MHKGATFWFERNQWRVVQIDLFGKQLQAQRICDGEKRWFSNYDIGQLLVHQLTSHERIERAAEDPALLDRIHVDIANATKAFEPNQPATLAALSVFVLTPHIREYLEEHDPQALLQARRALGMEAQS